MCQERILHSIKILHCLVCLGKRNPQTVVLSVLAPDITPLQLLPVMLQELKAIMKPRYREGKLRPFPKETYMIAEYSFKAACAQQLNTTPGEFV